MRATLEQRFWQKVHVSPEGCWDWMGGKNERGYGSIGQPTRRVHRFSWELHYGVIPHGMCVCHKCDNPSCVRPDHLFLGTVADNNHDMMAKGRAVFLSGEQRSPKLTERQVREIRRRSKTVLQYALAKEYGVHFATISKIVHRRSWKGV